VKFTTAPLIISQQIPLLPQHFTTSVPSTIPAPVNLPGLGIAKSCSVEIVQKNIPAIKTFFVIYIFNWLIRLQRNNAFNKNLTQKKDNLSDI